MLNILVVEDDIPFNRIVCSALNSNGYNAQGALSASEAYNLMYDTLFDLIVSDIMLPGIDGFELAETVRALNQTIPILFVSAREDFAAKQKGFRLGIDDYMTKPIHMDELLLRVGALVRRAQIAAAKRLAVGSLLMDADEMTASVNGEAVPMTVREFHILYKLLSYPKKTFSRQQLINEFWELGSDTSLRVVDVYITRIREKFAHCADFKIVTIYGLGYKAVTA